MPFVTFWCRPGVIRISGLDVSVWYHGQVGPIFIDYVLKFCLLDPILLVHSYCLLSLVQSIVRISFYSLDCYSFPLIAIYFHWLSFVYVDYYFLTLTVISFRYWLWNTYFPLPHVLDCGIPCYAKLHFGCFSESWILVAKMCLVVVIFLCVYILVC